ncbi:unnamed protein product [Brassica oleracea var. botrytis]|uniref:BnaCnng73180D protein n=2 Tax=Brassica TaxID=3705 RepID=A0A078JXS3_BRANA|nr:BnaCnng73180D [Brassica napus]VDD12119.1 unnamed protein product [Brassica oleracea]
MANSFVFLADLNLASVLSSLRCDFSGSGRHVKNWGELIGESSAVTNRRSWTSVTETTSGILDFWLSGKNTKR